MTVSVFKWIFWAQASDLGSCFNTKYDTMKCSDFYFIPHYCFLIIYIPWYSLDFYRALELKKYCCWIQINMSNFLIYYFQITVDSGYKTPLNFYKRWVSLNKIMLFLIVQKIYMWQENSANSQISLFVSFTLNNFRKCCLGAHNRNNPQPFSNPSRRLHEWGEN